MKELFETIREQCPKGLWAQGVKLAQKKRVRGESADDEEIVLRVQAAGLLVAPTVVLYPRDEDWECDCPSELDTCAHVAAAVIALTEARKAGKALPVAAQVGAAVHYCFESGKKNLHLRRFLVDGDKRQELETTLYSLVSKPGGAAKIDATNLDLEVDATIGPRPERILPLATLREVFSQLSSVHGPSPRVFLDGERVDTSEEPVLPLALIRDHKDGVRLSVMRAPEVDSIVADGVSNCGGVLRILGETSVTGLRLENLPITQTYGAQSLGELVTKVLPEIEDQVTLDIRTRRLPGTEADIEPTIDLDVSQDGQSLSVMATLVYGNPPQARIDNDRLVHLSGLVPLRDRATERALLSRLKDELHLVPGRRVTFEGVEATAFTEKLRRWRGEVSREKDVLYRFPLIPRLVIDGDRFEIYFETSEKEQSKEPQKVSAEAVVGAWRGGLGLVPVDGGGWAPLPADWLAEHGHKVADLVAARRESREDTPLIAMPTLAQLADSMGVARPTSFEALKPLVDDFEKLPAAELPEDLNATLRSYQETGVDWLSFLRKTRLGAVLADDMGLGKTLQTLCAVRPRALVVCPTSVLPNWQNEITRFRPALKTCIYHGGRRKLDTEADIVLTTYAILRIDQEKLGAIEWQSMVLDEAKAIKNPSSQAAKAAYSVGADFRIALSGTPVENRLDELWSLLHYTNPGLLGSRSDFLERYAKPVHRGEEGAAERLRRHIAPFVLRRLKRDVAPELPPRTDAVLHVELSGEERAVYDAVRAATRRDIVEHLSAGGSVIAALEALLRLRQAACHPQLIPGQKAESSSKVRTLLDSLETAVSGGHKCLVFSQWTSLLDLIEPHLMASDIAFGRLDGSTPDRGAVVDEFQSEDGPPVLLASLKAGGTGLNLTAADHVFLTDPWWNPAAEDQAADRAHRIGQDRPVMVYRLVSKGSVEERILELQEQKRSIADAALGEADRATSLTRDDLLFLLGSG